LASALKITSQFTGNLSNEYIVRERGPAPHEEAPVLPSDAAALRKEEAKEDGSKIIVTTITEDKRLAAVIAGIDHDVGIVPRGAFRKPITGPIERCKTFEGLSTAEAGKLSAYLHFHPSKHVQPKSYAEESQQDRTIDFLDPISDDTPKQSWSLQYQNGSEIVVIRSLVWLGSQFFHTAGKNEFAQVYFGNGVKNTDLPFML